MIGVWHRMPPATRQMLLWGALWGVIVSAAEGAVLQGYAVRGWRENLVFWTVDWCVPAWCAVGCLHLWVARRTERLGLWRGVAPGWLLVAVTWSFAQPGFIRGVCALITVDQPLLDDGLSVDWWTLGLFNVWINLFYGGLLVVVFLLSSRAERTRALLNDAAIAHSKTNALRDDLALAALQRQVDPKLLLGVMAEVEIGYRQEGGQTPAQADALLGRLVDFLRFAMPGLKDRASTLDAELQLARAYTELQAARGCTPQWTLDLPAVCPKLRFPSQFVLPLLALATPQSTPLLRMCDDGGVVRIEARGLGRTPPDDFLQQARLGLQSLLGARHTLALDGPAQITLTLHPHPPEGASDEDRPR